MISKALAVCHQYTIDGLPKDIIEEYQLVPQSLAMKEIHQPSSVEQLSQAIHRFKVNEFLEYHLQIQNNRLKVIHKKPLRSLNIDLIKPIIETLPYDLTEDQVEALSVLFKGANQPVTLSALLQGDVGSGKTIVALLYAYAYIKAGFSVAFMVPTEVLAMQHYLNATALFTHLQTDIHLLTSSTKTNDRKDMLEQVNRYPSLLIGTHALYSNDVVFNQLGLVIIDEQHRFGVAQRMKLIQKGVDVDVLSMSATPIPRTLAAVLFADMQVITLHHKPKQRGEVKTHIIQGNSFAPVLDDILQSIERNEQIGRAHV